MRALRKVVSGGQTGVDQGALEAALDAGLEVGGWCPPGRVSNAGVIPEKFDLQETPSERSNVAQDVPRSQRTEWNVFCSEATLIIIPSGREPGLGTKWTIECANVFRRPMLVCDPHDPNTLGNIVEWLGVTSAGWLNVAGPSEEDEPGIQAAAYTLLFDIFRQLT
jgi:hypothetical protein